MKTILVIFFSFFILFSFSQTDYDYSTYLNNLMKSEKNANQKKLKYKRNPNTTNYDLKYHRLEWNIDPAEHFIDGNVTSYFVANSDLTAVTFDLASNMNVTQVLQRGNVLNYTQNGNDELIITLPVTQNTGVLDSLTVSYNGIPTNTDYGSFASQIHDGVPLISTLSQPFGSKEWWPCKEDLSDKVDAIDIFVTHPSQYKTAANGLLISEIINGANTTTHWQHNYPIPAYLIAIAVTNYVTYNDHIDNGNFDIVNYVFPENLSFVQSKTDVAVDVMNFFSDLFEIYPYADEKYGHAEHTTFSIEHTTMSFMSITNNWDQITIAHELAHQWFGNKITCDGWENIWLNEGFATYLSGLVAENFNGDSAFRSFRNSMISFATNNTTNSNGSVFVENPTTIGNIFSRSVYGKGAILVHMLRKKLGDAVFFQALRNYLADPNLAFGFANTNDLITHLETESGIDLTEFFNDWYYGRGYPSNHLVWNYDSNSQLLTFTLNQTQFHPSVDFYEFPFSIFAYGSGQAPEELNFELSYNGQSFSIILPYEVLAVEFDPLKHLFSKNNSAVLGSQENILLNSITIFPNPTKNNISIKNPSNIVINSIKIYNMLGQKVNNSNNLNEIISLDNIEKGIYTIEIDTENGKLVKKIIKD